MRASPMDPAGRCVGVRRRVRPRSRGGGAAVPPRAQRGTREDFFPRSRVRKRDRRRALRRRRAGGVRRWETGSGRLRNGLLGLVATVALVAAASQTWGAEQHAGPVTLLQIELGTGKTKVVPSRDRNSLITAEVHGLSHVRQQLGSALGSLKSAKKFAGPPAPQQVRCSRAVRGLLCRLARGCVLAHPAHAGACTLEECIMRRRPGARCTRGRGAGLGGLHSRACAPSAARIATPAPRGSICSSARAVLCADGRAAHSCGRRARPLRRPQLEPVDAGWRPRRSWRRRMMPRCVSRVYGSDGKLSDGALLNAPV